MLLCVCTQRNHYYADLLPGNHNMGPGMSCCCAAVSSTGSLADLMHQLRFINNNQNPWMEIHRLANGAIPEYASTGKLGRDTG